MNLFLRCISNQIARWRTGLVSHFLTMLNIPPWRIDGRTKLVDSFALQGLYGSKSKLMTKLLAARKIKDQTDVFSTQLTEPSSPSNGRTNMVHEMKLLGPTGGEIRLRTKLMFVTNIDDKNDCLLSLLKPPTPPVSSQPLPVVGRSIASTLWHRIVFLSRCQYESYEILTI